MSATDAKRVTKISLGDLIQSHRPITYGVVQPGDPDPNGVVLIRGRDYSNGWKPAAELLRISPDVERSFARARLLPGDIVITIKGDVGNAALVPDWLEGANISQTNARLAIDSSKADARFVLAFLQSADGKRAVYRATQTGAQPGLIFEDIANFKLRLPPLKEQRRIADALAVWDRAIENAEALVAAKQRRRLGYLQRRVFGTPFAGADDTGLSLTQKRLAGSNGWPMREIGDFSTEVSRLNRAGEDLPVLSCTKHAGVVLSAEYFSGRRVHAEDTSGYKIVRRGEFVYATNHLEEGSIALQHLTDAGLVSPMYTVFSVDDTLIDRDFLFAVLKTERYRQVFQINTAASVDRRGGLRWEEFAALPFALPSLAEQQAIASALRALDKDIGADTARLNALRAQKRGLMQKLLTGEWRLKSKPSVHAA